MEHKNVPFLALFIPGIFKVRSFCILSEEVFDLDLEFLLSFEDYLSYSHSKFHVN